MADYKDIIKSFQENSIEQRSQEWYDLRTRFVGGSEGSFFIGEKNYKISELLERKVHYMENDTCLLCKDCNKCVLENPDCCEKYDPVNNTIYASDLEESIRPVYKKITNKIENYNDLYKLANNNPPIPKISFSLKKKLCKDCVARHDPDDSYEKKYFLNWGNFAEPVTEAFYMHFLENAKMYEIGSIPSFTDINRYSPDGIIELNGKYYLSEFKSIIGRSPAYRKRDIRPGYLSQVNCGLGALYHHGMTDINGLFFEACLRPCKISDLQQEGVWYSGDLVEFTENVIKNNYETFKNFVSILPRVENPVKAWQNGECDVNTVLNKYKDDTVILVIDFKDPNPLYADYITKLDYGIDNCLMTVLEANMKPGDPNIFKMIIRDIASGKVKYRISEINSMDCVGYHSETEYYLGMKLVAASIHEIEIDHYEIDRMVTCMDRFKQILDTATAVNILYRTINTKPGELDEMFPESVPFHEYTPSIDNFCKKVVPLTNMHSCGNPKCRLSTPRCPIVHEKLIKRLKTLI